MDTLEHEVRDIRRYVELELDRVNIRRLERVNSHRIGTTRFDVWDVHTDQGRWWVITPMTNLYLQDDFPSMDMALTFHVGVLQRLSTRRESSRSSDDEQFAPRASRLWQQADESMDAAEEAHDFQAVGMRLRETLIAFAEEVAMRAGTIPEDERPRGSDFVGWSKILADKFCRGRGAARIRSYMKVDAKAAWSLVNWLTHEVNARRIDAEIALSSVDHVLLLYTLASMRDGPATQASCPLCGSYQLDEDYRPESSQSGTVVLCKACGWEDAATGSGG